jgi:hypothetical protein
VIYGSASIASTIDLASSVGVSTIHGRHAEDRLSVSGPFSTGDLNGDGIEDLALGAVYADGSNDSRSDTGAAYPFFGRLDGLPDKWESDFGLDAFSPIGDDGYEGDPDGYFFTNGDEFKDSSDPIDPDSQPRQIIGCGSGAGAISPADVGGDLALLVLVALLPLLVGSAGRRQPKKAMAASPYSPSMKG